MTTETPSELAEEQVENTLEAVDSAPASEQSIRSIEDIAPKQKLKGKVKRVELQGAIIDLGLATDGLLHISQLRAEPVKNVTDVVKQGDEIVVYVLAADARAPRIDLTMIEPPAVTWQEIKVNQVYEGKVERIEKYGVFIDIGAERPGLIHVSELAHGFVSDPKDVVKVGDVISARVINVNKRKRQIDLSVRALEAPQVADIIEDEDEGEAVTAMEFALRRAMEQSDTGEMLSKKSKKRNKRKMRQEQQDIIARTLRLHQQND